MMDDESSESMEPMEIPQGSRPTLIFGDNQISLQHSVGQVERSLHAKTQLFPYSHFDTLPAFDGQTDGHTTANAEVAQRRAVRKLGT